MNVTLRDQLKQLRLSGLLESLEVRLQQAKASKLDYAEFLELILQDELVVRQDRQIGTAPKPPPSEIKNAWTISTSSSTSR